MEQNAGRLMRGLSMPVELSWLRVGEEAARGEVSLGCLPPPPPRWDCLRSGIALLLLSLSLSSPELCCEGVRVCVCEGV